MSQSEASIKSDLNVIPLPSSGTLPAESVPASDTQPGSTALASKRKPVHVAKSNKRFDSSTRYKAEVALPPVDLIAIRTPVELVGDNDRMSFSYTTDRHVAKLIMSNENHGLRIDFANPQKYALYSSIGLSDIGADERILQELEETCNLQASKSRQKLATWMRRTNYDEYSEFARRKMEIAELHAQAHEAKAARGVTTTKAQRVLQEVAKFEDIQHVPKSILDEKAKKGVTLVDAIPILPNFTAWGTEFVYYTFDEHPLDGLLKDLQDEIVENRLELEKLGVAFGSADERFRCYFPMDMSNVSVSALRSSENETIYRHARDYAYDSRARDSDKDVAREYIFVLDPDGDGEGPNGFVAKYSEVSHKVNLKKRPLNPDEENVLMKLRRVEVEYPDVDEAKLGPLLMEPQDLKDFEELEKGD